MATLADVMSKVNAINKTVGSIQTAVGRLPGRITDAAAGVPKGITDSVAETRVGKLAEDLMDSVEPIETAAVKTREFFAYLEAERQKFEGDKDRFKTELETFVRDLRNLAFQVRRLLFDREEPIDTGLLDKALEAMPDALVLILYKALEPVPLWREAPGDVLHWVEQVPSLGDLKRRQCAELLDRQQLHDAIEDAVLTTRITIKILDLALSHIPKDLSVHVNVVGGGGLTVSTHPVHLFFDWSKWTLELVEQLFDKYLTTYDACAAARDAAELAAWREAVTASLARLEARLA